MTLEKTVEALVDKKMEAVMTNLDTINGFLGLKGLKAVKATGVRQHNKRISPEMKEKVLVELREGKLSTQMVAAKFGIKPTVVASLKQYYKHSL